MRSNTLSLLCLLSLATLLGVNGAAAVAPTVVPRHDLSSFNKTLFPSTFVFGIGSSAYQARQKGKIGITIPTHFFLPKSNTAADNKAASRALDFFFGWYAHPVTYGDYPESMRSSVGARLPAFTKAESEGLKNSIDFLGVNYYTTYYAEHAAPVTTNRTFYTDILATLTTERNGLLVGPKTDLNWLFIYPKGIHHLMLHIRDQYKNPDVYITENGIAESRNDSIPVDEARKDAIRIRYHNGHLQFLLQAIKDGVNVKGYYAWSFSDSFEWDAGYTVRFGLIYVDYKNNLKRYPKFPSTFATMEALFVVALGLVYHKERKRELERETSGGVLAGVSPDNVEGCLGAIEPLEAIPIHGRHRSRVVPPASVPVPECRRSIAGVSPECGLFGGPKRGVFRVVSPTHTFIFVCVPTAAPRAE
ncbi:Vicianin hydrolase [Vigna angularis]|uniref:Vicianin hydrolase n=1 Tax=Phaseolus angularis TaxID=3914 RepID=A0A8T0JJ78_PHAAN|nr:Vicianin hydrolase [Vigna angularis]